MSRAKLVARIVSTLVLASLAACASTPEASQETAEIEAYKLAMEAASRPASPEQVAAAQRSDPLTRANFWGQEYRKDASNLQTIVSFMSALRGIRSHDRVLEVATTALPMHPNSYEILLELGRSLLANDKPREAAQAFISSADFAPLNEAAPLAALGVAFDRLENHLKAQEAYAFALAREPERVSTLSNYGLSLALSGDLSSAEAQLRKAVALPGADVRIRQNLALILGLQGRFDEMVAVDPNAPRRTVEANRDALRTMMIPARDYSALEVEPVPEMAAPKVQAMPDVRETEVVVEDMPVLKITETQTEAGKVIDLTGAPEPENAPRPVLRGSQDG